MTVTGYVETQKGFILAAEAVLSLVVLICYADSWYGSIFMPAGALIFSAGLFVIFTAELDVRFLRRVHWLWIDLLRVVVDGGYYLIASPVILCDFGRVDSAGLAGAMFGLTAGLVYAYDMYAIVLQLRSRRNTAAARV